MNDTFPGRPRTSSGTADVSAVRILDTVWQVGGAGLTDDHDCHCYLVWDGSDGILIDTGTGLGAQRWFSAITEVCDPTALTGAALTHYHGDHAGGAAAAHEGGLTVMGSPETAAALRAGDEVRTSLAVARALGVYPDTYRLAQAPVGLVPDIIHAGALDIETIPAPGHCDGHLVFLVRSVDRTILFSGDCLFAGGRVSLQAIPDCRLDRYAETVIGLAERDIDVLLPGHGDMVLHDARTVIATAARSFARLIPPPNFLN